MRNILVTGGLGYIGSHTSIKLIEKGYNVFIIDSLVNSSRKVFNKIKTISSEKLIKNRNKIFFYKGDVRDKYFLNKIFSISKDMGLKIDLVIHFAGLKSVSESELNPNLYWEINVEGAKILFDCMQNNDCKSIIFSSSATVYGNYKDKILTEDLKRKPSNFYGKTKSYVEDLLFDIYKNSNDSWRVINLRYFNPIGAHPSGLIGENIEAINNNLFPEICKVAIGKKKELNIYGKNWLTKDGTCVRDFIHISDIADGHVDSINYLDKFESKFESINLGTGIGTTILELIKIFESANNIKINYVFKKRRKGDIASYVSSNNLAHELIKWRPKLSLKQMCKDGWNWYNVFYKKNHLCK